MRTAFETTNLQARNDFFRQIPKLIGNEDFFTKIIDESIEV